MDQASRRVNVRAIIYRDGQILAVKHKSKDGSAAAYYSVPGGGLDPGESLTDGIRREILEETGIDAIVGRLLFIQQFGSSRPDYSEELEFFYLIENADDFMAIDLNSTSHGTDEIAVCEFVDPSQVFILPDFLRTIDLADYVCHVRPTYLYVEL